MSTKPCIQCGKECDIFPLQLGDVFTLTLLRICSEECMFMEAYDYLYEIGEHKAFRSFLYDKQNQEDKAERDAYIKELTNESIKGLKESPALNPDLLTNPLPKMAQDFLNMPLLPTSGSVMRFTRYTISKEDRMKAEIEKVEKLKAELKEAMDNLEKIQNENAHVTTNCC